MKTKIFTIATLVITGFAMAQTFTLKSKDLGGQFVNAQFANGFGCTGENVSPELNWENAPRETKSFAVTMYDLDAPTGSGLWHWVVYNIPPSVTSLVTDSGSLTKNKLPKGAINGLNDIGVRGYFGVCPPEGQLHRYVITVYALNNIVQVDDNASAALTGFILNMNTIAKASLIAYGKK